MPDYLVQQTSEFVHCYDSVPCQWPKYADFILAYIDVEAPGGGMSNYAYAIRHRPHAHIISITTKGEPNARVADCEKGDLTPAQAAEWAIEEDRAGRLPMIYCDASTKDLIIPLLKGAHCQWWLADWDNKAIIPPGYSAKQYSSNNQYDTSVIYTKAALIKI